jgi:hypothetical protein
MRDHMHERNEVSAVAFETIDWWAIDRAVRLTPAYFQIWASKFSTGQLSVGKMMKRWKKQPHDLCPCCHQPEETVPHLLQCPDARMQATYHTEVQHFADELPKIGTSPEFLQWIIPFLHSQPFEFQAPYDYDLLNDAIREQLEIGRHNLLQVDSLSHGPISNITIIWTPGPAEPLGIGVNKWHFFSYPSHEQCGYNVTLFFTKPMNLDVP